MKNEIMFPASKRYKVQNNSELEIKFDHKSVEKTLEFWEKQLVMISHIRTNLMIYQKFVRLGMVKEAETVLENSCISLDEMKELQLDMKDSILELENDKTTSISYGKIYIIDGKKKSVA